MKTWAIVVISVFAVALLAAFIAWIFSLRSTLRRNEEKEKLVQKATDRDSAQLRLLEKIRDFWREEQKEFYMKNLQNVKDPKIFDQRVKAARQILQDDLERRVFDNLQDPKEKNYQMSAYRWVDDWMDNYVNKWRKV